MDQKIIGFAGFQSKHQHLVLFKKCKDGKRARPIAPRQWNETIQHYLSIEIIHTDPNSSLETAGKPCDKNP